MTQDRRYWGLQVGPLILGGSEARRPRTQAEWRRDQWWNIATWFAIAALIAPASLLLAAVITLVTTTYLIALLNRR